MIVTKKCQIYPSLQAIEDLWNISYLCTDLWNGALEERTYRRNNSADMLSQKKDIVLIKEYCPEFKEPSSQVIQNVVIYLDRSFKSFYTKREKGDYLANPPKFKSKKYFFTQEYSQYKTSFLIQDNSLKIAYGNNKKSWITIALPKELQFIENFKTVKIIHDKDKNKYYASFTYDFKEITYTKNEHSMYFDPGSKAALTGITTDGEFFEYNVCHLRETNMQTYLHIDNLKSTLKNKIKGSTRYIRINKKIKKCFSKINTRTKMVLSKISNKIIEDHPKINQFKIGNWTTPQSISKTENKIKDKRINRAMQNNNPLTKLINILSYKAQIVGKKVSKFDEKGTTRTCSMCGKKHKKGYSPEKRIFKCVDQLDCKFEYPRDNQSGLNFIKKHESALWQSLVGNLPTSSKKIQINVFSCKIQNNKCYF